MKVKFQLVDGVIPVLTISTEITKDMVETGKLIAKDNGNEVYRVTKAEKANVSTFCFTGNSYVDNKLVASIVLPNGTRLEDAKKMYGDALLAANTHIPQIVEEAKAKSAAIETMFS